MALTAGTIRVIAEEGRQAAEVTVTTADAEGPSAEAVRSTTFHDGPRMLTVRVPDVGGGMVSSQSVYASGTRTHVAVNHGIVVGGMVMVGSGSMIVGGNVVFGGSPITVEARLPKGSSLIVDTTAGAVTTLGDMYEATVRSVSGRVKLDGVAAINVKTVSGSVAVDRFAGAGHIKTVSGDVLVIASAESTLTARTVSGDIATAGARVHLSARSVSGRVSN